QRFSKHRKLSERAINNGAEIMERKIVDEAAGISGSNNNVVPHTSVAPDGMLRGETGGRRNCANGVFSHMKSSHTRVWRPLTSDISHLILTIYRLVLVAARHALTHPRTRKRTYIWENNTTTRRNSTELRKSPNSESSRSGITTRHSQIVRCYSTPRMKVKANGRKESSVFVLRRYLGFQLADALLTNLLKSAVFYLEASQRIWRGHADAFP
ncbi:hypothetical protein CLF_100335, partial [Clonorchis sinensis]